MWSVAWRTTHFHRRRKNYAQSREKAHADRVRSPLRSRIGRRGQTNLGIQRTWIPAQFLAPTRGNIVKVLQLVLSRSYSTKVLAAIEVTSNRGAGSLGVDGKRSGSENAESPLARSARL